MKNIFKKYLAVYLVIILICVGFIGGLWVGQRTAPEPKGEARVVNLPGIGEKPAYLLDEVDFDLWREVWQVVKENYIDRDKILDTEIFYGALAGMVASLGDPHSTFFDPKTTLEFSEELQRSFEGIGAEISIKKGQLIVVSALPDTPAARAGLQSGDAILEIDGQMTAGMPVDEAVSKIRGPKGIKVILTIARQDWSSSQKIEIIRDAIHFDSVVWEQRQDGLFYIKITSFNNDTFGLFNKAVSETLVKNPKGIILDLRGNPGGYLDQAIKIASGWIASGPVVLEAYDGQQKSFDAEGLASLQDYPTVVLVNGGSASGSEIVAGALQDYQKATLVGTKTFGKGSVQELEMLSDGSSIKITVARWLTPKGRQIDKEGITPDITMERTKEDYDNDRDPQLDKAVEILLGAVKSE